MSQIIPKIIHQIWLGGTEVPRQYLAFMESWKRYHPDWEYHLWTADNMIELQNQNIYDATTNLVQKTNMARYEILYQFGGIYVELGTACFKNIEPLLEGVEFFVKTKADFYYANSLMGCVPHHELMGELVDGISRSLQLETATSIDEQSGSLYMMKYLLWMPQVTMLEESMLVPEQESVIEIENRYCYQPASLMPSVG